MNLSEKHKIIIIGAGAAGLMAAVSACAVIEEKMKRPDVIILEGNASAGKKITATGNGKCNFTNLMQPEGCYRSTTPQYVSGIINRFDEKKTILFFERCGVPCYERDGYCYPLSEQAKSVRDALEYKAFKSGARIYYNKNVTDITELSVLNFTDASSSECFFTMDDNEVNARFRITCENDETQYQAEKLIVCTGGAAAPVFGTDGRMFNLLAQMSIPCIKRLPALCGLKLNEADVKGLDGVRIKCLTKLYTGSSVNMSLSKECYSEFGEIIFNKSGISGIPVLNLSRFAVEALESGLNAELHFDFFPSDTDRELFDYLVEILSTLKMSPLKSFCGIMNDRLLRKMLLAADISPEEKPDLSCEAMFSDKLSCLVSIFKDFRLTVTGYQDFDNSQTTQGGVRLDSVTENLESKYIPGLYFAGEVLDVDGKCGGYNLQWAWSSGYIAGEHAAE